jgi:hypothetical protein
MSFQWIIDSASDVTIDKSGLNAQVVTRASVTRTASRGAKPWRFSVTPSQGLRWTDPEVRSNIEKAEALNMYTEGTIGFTATNHNWLFAWQGTGSTSGASASFVKGESTITLSGSCTFKAGDIIQLGASGHVYSITADSSAGSVPVNRPIVDATGSASLIIGSLCTWKVVCVKYPTYKITPLGFIEWSGTFDFIEAL